MAYRLDVISMVGEVGPCRSLSSVKLYPVMPQLSIRIIAGASYDSVAISAHYAKYVILAHLHVLTVCLHAAQTEPPATFSASCTSSVLARYGLWCHLPPMPTDPHMKFSWYRSLILAE